jgi:hypothetical protein
VRARPARPVARKTELDRHRASHFCLSVRYYRRLHSVIWLTCAKSTAGSQ